MLLIDFSDGSKAAAWQPIHDVVMGGRSSGRVAAGESGARFEGSVSLENGGGFASFRAPLRLPDLTRFDGLRLRVRGDGQVYKLALRTDGGRDGVSWQAPFATSAGAWTEVELAFEDLAPTWRGRPVAEAGPLDRTCIRQLGLVIADGQAGPFALELASLHALEV